MTLFELDLSKIVIKSRYFKPEAVTKTAKNVTFVTAENKNVTDALRNNTQNQYVNAVATKITKATKIIDWKELFEERAAFMEFEGGLSRIDAEVKTFNELVYKYCDENNCNNTDFAVYALLEAGLKNPYHKAEYK